MNVHMYLFDDLGMAKEAISFLPEDIDIHLMDGRYTDFPGEYDLTPEAGDWASKRDNVIYHKPPEEKLPFGDPEDTENRRSVHEKARWVNEEALPEDEWTLKLDTDGFLTEFDPSVVEELDEEIRWRIEVRIEDEGRRFHLTRLWKPKYWTYWINDCLIPRSEVPRDTVLSELPDLWQEYKSERRKKLEDWLIINRGTERADDYIERRVEHLESIGREGRADMIRKNVL